MKNSTTVNGTSDGYYLELDPLQRLFFDGDYLELDDLADPLSHSSSSDNSCRSSLSFDELEDNNRNNQIHQGKDSSAKCRVTASIRPLEMVMQPAPSSMSVFISLFVHFSFILVIHIYRNAYIDPGCIIIRFQNFHSYGNFGNELSD